jgi:hypothetical protein
VASFNTMAMSLLEAGDIEGAGKLFERALAIADEALGPDDPRTAVALSNLAALSTRYR